MRCEDGAPAWDIARRSLDLVESLDEIATSAINWFEIHRNLPDAQRSLLAKWHGRIFVLPVDARVAEQAASIYVAARKSGKLCTKCFAFFASVQCEVCNNHRSRAQRSNDIVVVAAAEVNPEIQTLYSCDAGVVALGDFVKTVEIKNPPPPRALQLPMKEIADIRDVGRRGRKK